ncbi:hypothetical protein [Rhizorhabdus sp.]|uniref:hypothetical protein n=1 Tax=Rhizorhabdus sp. TaxID=1968843 RepID=UPI0019C10181|nr:hypothetical protein [Rhizorhabdus sp.]MBD3762445.1 hypothetical protein [Rhizorhabdus sp.]
MAAALGVEPRWEGNFLCVGAEDPPAPPAVPQQVTARQARLALLSAGKLDMIEGALAALPGPEGRAAQIEWEYASEIRRDSPLIAALAPAIGFNDAQVDDLFRMAEGL